MLNHFYKYETFVDLRVLSKRMEKLTQQEEDAMQVIWNISKGFVKDILDELPEPKPPYTTLASTIKNLEKKGFVKSEKLGNSYRYSPLIKHEEYKKKFMKGFVSGYFKNSYKDLVEFFAKEEKISTDELKAIITMIEKENKK